MIFFSAKLLAAWLAWSAALFGLSTPAPSFPAGAVPQLHLAHAATAFKMTQSNNWSGYNQGVLSTGTPYNSVAATWVVPKASPYQSGQNEYSATWTGIGGGCLNTACDAGDSTLIQAGTEQDVSTSGQASYSSWYELVPAPSITTPLAVAPGNEVSVRISQALPEVWTITIDNLSQRTSWSTTLPYSSDFTTAEWVEETPVVAGSSGAQVGPLPRLSTVSFLSATANGVDPHLTWADAVQLVDFNGNVLATPSLPNTAGDAFNVCSYASSCPAPKQAVKRVVRRS